jgi:hypothetical protein
MRQARSLLSPRFGYSALRIVSLNAPFDRGSPTTESIQMPPDGWDIPSIPDVAIDLVADFIDQLPTGPGAESAASR